MEAAKRPKEPTQPDRASPDLQPAPSRTARAQLLGRSRRGWSFAAALLVVIGLLAALTWPHFENYSGVGLPPQFDAPLTRDVGSSHRPVLGVAHNAGNNPQTTATALRHGAAVIEIDVIDVRGELAAGRIQPWPWLAQRVFRGQSLEQAWQAAAAAQIIKLDLQQTDQALLDQLVRFLDTRPRSSQAMISTRDAQALLYLRPKLPNVTLLFSTAFPDAVRQIEADAALAAAANGLSVFQGLVDPQLVTWAHDRGMLVVAWTVNDGIRLNQLLRLGVDGVTTQNLAVLDALAAPRRRRDR